MNKPAFSKSQIDAFNNRSSDIAADGKPYISDKMRALSEKFAAERAAKKAAQQ